MEFYNVTLANGFTCTVRATDKGVAYHKALNFWRRCLVNGAPERGVEAINMPVDQIFRMTVLSHGIEKVEFRPPADLLPA